MDRETQLPAGHYSRVTTVSITEFDPSLSILSLFFIKMGEFVGFAVMCRRNLDN